MNVNFPDAVVVLAYFCENDGPRVVMTTQAVPRPSAPPSFALRRTNIPLDKVAELQADAPYTINVLSIMECHKPLGKRTILYLLLFIYSRIFKMISVTIRMMN